MNSGSIWPANLRDAQVADEGGRGRDHLWNLTAPVSPCQTVKMTTGEMQGLGAQGLSFPRTPFRSESLVALALIFCVNGFAHPAGTSRTCG